MYKKITYVFLIIQMGVFSQQIPLNTLYSYNKLPINPASAGLVKGIEMNLSHRQQWVGFEGAPATTWLTSQMQLSPKIGLGFSMAYDQVAFLERFNCEGTFSYHLKINKKNGIHLGMSLGILQGSMKLDNVISSEISYRTFGSKPVTIIIAEANKRIEIKMKGSFIDLSDVSSIYILFITSK